MQTTTQSDATKDDDFIFLFQNLDVVPKNTYKSRKIHRHLEKRDRIIAMKVGKKLKDTNILLKNFHLLPGRSVRRVAADDYSLI